MKEITSGSRREGFWFSPAQPKLPLPKTSKSWSPGNFPRMLKRVQKKASRRSYKGWSTCRICNKGAGSSEYSYKGFTWPSGLIHYITEHNVKPSARFIKFVRQNGG